MVKKVLALTLCCSILFISCSKKEANIKKLNLNSIQLQISVPQNYNATYVEKKSNSKDNKNIQILIEDNNKENNFNISQYHNITVDDYIAKYGNFIEINYVKYDKYMEYIKKDISDFYNIYYSCGTYSVKNKNKKYESICFEKNNNSYHLEFFGDEYINLKNTLSNAKYIESPNVDINKEKGIDLKSQYTIYELDTSLYTTIPTQINDTYWLEYPTENYYFFFSPNKNKQIIFLTSNYSFKKLSSDYWHFVNGIEIVQIKDDCIIAHDINNNENYYLNTKYVYTKNNVNQKCIEIVYLDKSNQKEMVSFIKNTTKYMNKTEYATHYTTLKYLIKGD